MRKRAFTLLEVMVAVAILGLALTSILSAQAGLFSAGSHAQRESLAIGLLRCKMGELEERLLKLGYPELDSKEEGICCDDPQAAEGFRCTWDIQRVELPQPLAMDTVDGGSSISSVLNPTGSASPMPASTGAMGAYGGGMMPPMPNGVGAFGTLFQVGTSDAGIGMMGSDGGLSSLANMMGGATSTGVAGLAPLVMTIVYPSLKPMLEASIRKLTVKVEWTEGMRKHDLTIVQYVTNPMRGGFMGMPMGSAMPGMPGMPGTTGQFGATDPGTTATSTPRLPGLPTGR